MEGARQYRDGMRPRQGVPANLRQGGGWSPGGAPAPVGAFLAVERFPGSSSPPGTAGRFPAGRRRADRPWLEQFEGERLSGRLRQAYSDR